MVIWSTSHLGCLEIGSSAHRSAAVQFGRVVIANLNQQRWHYLSESAMPQPQHESAGRTLRYARRRSLLCLSQGIEDQQSGRPTGIAHLALKANRGQPPAHVLHVSYLSVCLTSACVSDSAEITLPLSPSPWNSKKLQRTTRSLLLRFPPWNPNKCSSVTQCKAD